MTSPRLPEFYYTYGPNPPSDSTNRAGEKNSLPSLDIDILKTLTDKRKSRGMTDPSHIGLPHLLTPLQTESRRSAGGQNRIASLP